MLMAGLKIKKIQITKLIEQNLQLNKWISYILSFYISHGTAIITKPSCNNAIHPVMDKWQNAATVPVSVDNTRYTDLYYVFLYTLWEKQWNEASWVSICAYIHNLTCFKTDIGQSDTSCNCIVSDLYHKVNL